MSEEEKESERTRQHELVKTHCDQLAEHFDTVQIFCSRHMPAERDGTVSLQWGAGNWFARYGQVREFVVFEEERIRVQAQPREG